MKVSILNQAKITILKFIQAGHHYWFAIGLLFAFCIHQMQINITQRSLFDQIEHQIGHRAPGTSVHGLRSMNTISCSWYHNNTSECDELLRSRLPLGNDLVVSDDFIRRRWLFLGDSTMKRLFANSPLRTQLIVEPFNSLAQKKAHECWQGEELNGLICQQRMAQRCRLNEIFDLPYADEWIRPQPENFEGPLKYGLQNQYCSDCSGCMSNFLDCQIKELGLSQTHIGLRPCDRKRLTYGGYISIEFARDLEIQTPKFKTTQENVAAYLHTSWNAPGGPLVQKWGLPICVINTSAHDSMLDSITVEGYIKNVNWYLNLFVSECSHIVWLSNTAPANDATNFPQTERLMKSYDEAVMKLLTHSRVLNRMSSFINVFDESMNWPHADHIHMNDSFYHKLGEWMVETFMKY